MKGKHTVEKRVAWGEGMPPVRDVTSTAGSKGGEEGGSKRSSTQPRKHDTCVEAPFHCLGKKFLPLGFQVF
jgi:hypothetical protein